MLRPSFYFGDWFLKGWNLSLGGEGILTTSSNNESSFVVLCCALVTLYMILFSRNFPFGKKKMVIGECCVLLISWKGKWNLGEEAINWFEMKQSGFLLKKESVMRPWCFLSAIIMAKGLTSDLVNVVHSWSQIMKLLYT